MMKVLFLCPFEACSRRANKTMVFRGFISLFDAFRRAFSEGGLIKLWFSGGLLAFLALGMGFTNTICGYGGLDIDAVMKNGKKVPIFRRGKWAFKV